MRVLGIDPGSEVTGWGVVEGDANGRSYRLIEFGAIRLTAGSTFSSRLSSRRRFPIAPRRSFHGGRDDAPVPGARRERYPKRVLKTVI